MQREEANSAAPAAKKKKRAPPLEWAISEEVLAVLPTPAELVKKGKQQQPHRSEAVPYESGKKQHIARRSMAKWGSRVGNLTAMVSAAVRALVVNEEEKEALPTAAKLREKVAVTVLKWPSDAPRLVSNLNQIRIKFSFDLPTNPCGCEGPCWSGPCRNVAEGVECRTEICSQSAVKCGRGLHEARGLQLRSTVLGISVFVARRVGKGFVVASYSGVLGNEDRRHEGEWQYTVKLKQRDVHGQKVFLSAEEIGGVARFLRHSCDANTLLMSAVRCNWSLILHRC